ncbi:hypothetical protein QTP70_005712 [Hemibagrus guttatus]|uniref:Uncharacterized protein n=1 Tax=Hemibagrus guttatus TaxID=175788 RepID=A0AAE0REF0_9TELE|nr:hypothetical protein QTP70_005712 [Hemibagrus guttatus]
MIRGGRGSRELFYSSTVKHSGDISTKKLLDTDDQYYQSLNSNKSTDMKSGDTEIPEPPEPPAAPEAPKTPEPPEPPAAPEAPETPEPEIPAYDTPESPTQDRSTEDHVLYATLTYFEGSEGIYLRKLLCVDHSSAFSTIVPHCLASKFRTLGPNTPLDFLSSGHQLLRDAQNRKKRKEEKKKKIARHEAPRTGISMVSWHWRAASYRHQHQHQHQQCCAVNVNEPVPAVVAVLVMVLMVMMASPPPLAS